MSRVIKFRVWAIFNTPTGGQMSNPFGLVRPTLFSHDEVTFPDKSGLVIDSRPLASVLDDLSGILMQFTGLLDRHGKEIYEGDVVQADAITPTPMEVYADHAVYTPPQRHCVKLPESYKFLGYRTPIDAIEILGNIYEQPNLMQEPA